MAPNDRTTGIYRRVAVNTWDDEKFKRLSRPKPNAQTLWMFLLTGPLTRAIPGTVVGGLGTIADTLAWPLRSTRACWQEIAAAGMATADWESRLVWLPNGLKRNPPSTLETIDAWRAAFPELPECELRRRIEDEVTVFLRAYGLDFVQAWLTASDDREVDLRLRRVFRTTPALRDAIKKRDGGCCRYCGRRVSWTDRRGPQAGAYSHVDPTGPTEFTNLVTACRACASRKGHLSVEAAGLVLRPEGLPGLDPDPDLGTDPGATRVRSWPQEQEQDQEQDPGTYVAAGASTLALTCSTRADGLKTLAWDTALAIAHRAIETCEQGGASEADWPHEFRALCRDQRWDYSPTDSAGTPLDTRALAAAKAIRATRSAVFAETPRPVTGVRRPRIGAAS